MSGRCCTFVVLMVTKQYLTSPCCSFNFQSATASPWPSSHFDDDVAFVDPDRRRNLGGTAGVNNWSNDEFAVKIKNFADNNGIYGCGIIAHSQGGLAALHLRARYHSCLDNASSGTRLIQSVGSPYQGTPLAAGIAALGEVFGAGCGSNNDLTPDGADTWLATIPTSARQDVYYYTTKFSDSGKWWVNDYCNFWSDLVLSDPEDGTVEDSKGQLPSGNNMGLTSGQCHTTGMTDDPQYEDQGRNTFMNNNARF